jgi:CMP/dCMP kinase
MVIAIDGPAGAGKSSVARGVAAKLGYTYLDSGAMYRSVALAALRRGLDPAVIASQLRIELGDGFALLDGEDVTPLIRTPKVSEAASRAAADPEVRRAMVELQRRLLSSGDWVAEGRDIGTVVAPHAQLKVFLTADSQARARRRAAERGAAVDATEAAQARRDRLDAAQSQMAADAVLLDATDLTLAEVIEEIARMARERSELACTGDKSS